jgi:hypothetical protein
LSGFRNPQARLLAVWGEVYQMSHTYLINDWVDGLLAEEVAKLD